MLPGGQASSSTGWRTSTINPLNNTFIFSNGDKYDAIAHAEGEYLDLGQGKERHGIGTYYHSNGNIYIGSWVRDKMSGNGELKFLTGAAYKGEFEHNEYCGFGMYTWPDGSHFTGRFIKNRMSGKGEFIDSKGCTWIGTFTGKEGFMKVKLS